MHVLLTGFLHLVVLTYLYLLQFQEGEITAIMNEFERPGTHATLFIGGTSYNVVQGIDGSVIRARLEVRII